MTRTQRLDELFTEREDRKPEMLVLIDALRSAFPLGFNRYVAKRI